MFNQFSDWDFHHRGDNTVVIPHFFAHPDPPHAFLRNLIGLQYLTGTDCVIGWAAGYPVACCGEESSLAPSKCTGVSALGSADGIKVAWNSEEVAMLFMT